MGRISNKIIKKKLPSGEIVYLNSENEEFKLIFIDHLLKYKGNWKDDKIAFSEDERDKDDELLSPGQIYINIKCLSVAEYMEVSSYFMEYGWGNRLLPSGENLVDVYGIDSGRLDWWSAYNSEINKEAQWHTYDSILKGVMFYNRDRKRGLREVWNWLYYEESERSISLRVKTDFNKLDQFRDIMKGLGTIGYKAIWYDGKTKPRKNGRYDLKTIIR